MHGGVISHTKMQTFIYFYDDEFSFVYIFMRIPNISVTMNLNFLVRVGEKYGYLFAYLTPVWKQMGEAKPKPIIRGIVQLTLKLKADL